MKVFKILDTATGLYSKGGQDVLHSKRAWSKTGKTWSCEGHIKSHLTALVECWAPPVSGKRVIDNSKIPKSWMIVEIIADIEAGTSFTRTYPARELAERPAKK